MSWLGRVVVGGVIGVGVSVVVSGCCVIGGGTWGDPLRGNCMFVWSGVAGSAAVISSDGKVVTPVPLPRWYTPMSAVYVGDDRVVLKYYDMYSRLGLGIVHLGAGTFDELVLEPAAAAVDGGPLLLSGAGIHVGVENGWVVCDVDGKVKQTIVADVNHRRGACLISESRLMCVSKADEVLIINLSDGSIESAACSLLRGSAVSIQGFRSATVYLYSDTWVWTAKVAPEASASTAAAGLESATRAFDKEKVIVSEAIALRVYTHDFAVRSYVTGLNTDGAMTVEGYSIRSGVFVPCKR